VASTARELGALLVRRMRSVARLPPRELATTARVVVVMSVVELLIRWVPLPRLTRLLGVRVDLGPSGSERAQVSLDDMPPRARRQLVCTRRVADAWPLSRGPCLRRALVGGHLIRELDPAIRIGTSDGADGIVAHAWLELDDRALETVDGFTPFQAASSKHSR
jgi:hypothetical protein